MADLRWLGDSVAVAQVSTVQVTAFDVTTTYTLSINGKDVEVLGVTDEDATAAALQVALAASTIPEFAEITYTVLTDTITMTADTAGKPFTVVSSDTGGAGTIAAVAAVTANDGPNVWTANNFGVIGDPSTRQLPTTGDNVYIVNNAVDILYGLEQQGAGLFAELHVEASYTGKIGLRVLNSDGDINYNEYRDLYLHCQATKVDIGQGAGAVLSGRVKLNLDTTQTAITVYRTGNPETPANGALMLLATHASNTIDVLTGVVEIAPEGGEVSTFLTIRATAGSIRCGDGCTLTTIINNGADITIEDSVTTLTVHAGTTSVFEVATAGTINADGGTVNWLSSGTITTLLADGPTALINFDGDLRAKTVTNATVKQGATVTDSAEVVVWTNGIQMGKQMVG